MNKEIEELLSPYSDIEMDIFNDNEIEIELSEYTSLIYSKNENKYFVETFSDSYEEKLEIDIDTNNLQEIKCVDYIVTINDIQDLINLIGKNNE